MHWQTLIDKTIEYYKIEPSERKKKYMLPHLYRDYPLPPLNQSQWAEVVSQLGFDPGPFISQLYLKVGGGFVGPDYGTLRTDKSDTSHFHLVDYHVTNQQYNKRYPSWYWPPKLLALINCGCAIVSCVDCSTDQLEVIRFDPHYYTEQPRRDWSGCFRAEAESLYEWWERWLAGEEPWEGDAPKWKRYEDLIPEERRKRRKQKRRVSELQAAFDFDID